VDEVASKARLASCGLPVPEGRVTGLAGLAAAAATFNGPVVLKAVSGQLPHKTEAGAIALNLIGVEAVSKAAEAMAREVHTRKPGLQIDRFLIEPMVKGSVAEVLVGVTIDPRFDPVLVIGAGGILVKLLRDVARSCCRLRASISRKRSEG
jgi:acyl-CoA synthetase (NDP forming)